MRCSHGRALAPDVLCSNSERFLVCGDFNSKSSLWGSSYTNSRGTLVEKWAAANDLRLLNCGMEPTCIRTQGTSIIDLSWATPNLIEWISDWQVLADTITLSNHTYILMNVELQSACRPNKRIVYPRWNWRKMDWEKFISALVWSCAVSQQNEDEIGTIEGFVDWIGKTMTRACDAAGKRSKNVRGKKSTGGMRL